MKTKENEKSFVPGDEFGRVGAFLELSPLVSQRENAEPLETIHRLEVRLAWGMLDRIDPVAHSMPSVVRIIVAGLLAYDLHHQLCSLLELHILSRGG